MATARLRAKRQVTVPRDVAEAARLEEGDPIEFEMVEDGILMRPQKVIDASQAWFWTPEWQAGEREADREAAAGEGTFYEDTESLIAGLEAARER